MGIIEHQCGKYKLKSKHIPDFDLLKDKRYKLINKWDFLYEQTKFNYFYRICIYDNLDQEFKFNYISDDGVILYPNLLFNNSINLHNIFICCYVHGLDWNFITSNGQLASNNWFKQVVVDNNYFSRGTLVRIKEEMGWNFLTEDGLLYDFYVTNVMKTLFGNYYVCEYNNMCYKIDSRGNLEHNLIPIH